MKYKLSQFARISIRGNRAIISSIKTGLSTKISKECWEIMQQWLNLGLTEKEFFAAFEDEGDREYFQGLVTILRDNQLIVPSDLEEKWEMKSISVEVTHRCNLACRHCAVSAGTIREQEYHNFDRLIELLDRVIQLQPREIVITGGEPLVRADIIPVLEHLKENYSGYLTLMTNATLITKENVRKYLPYFYSWNISVDGVNEETCAAIRGKGVFAKVISAIHLLQSEGIENISLSMVETSGNEAYVEDFFALCKKLNVFPMVREYAEEGRGKLNSDQLKPHEEKKSLEEALAEAREIGNSNMPRESCYHCGAGQNEFHIDYRGDVYPCGPLTYPEFKICNVLEQADFVQYMRTGAYKSSDGYRNLDFYTPDNFPRCKDCPNNLFCWRCLSETLLICKQPDRLEKWCQYSQLELMHLWK